LDLGAQSSPPSRNESLVRKALLFPASGRPATPPAMYSNGYGAATVPPDYSSEAGYPYPMKSSFMSGQRRHFNVPAMCVSFWVPFFIFVVVAGTLSFSIHFETPGTCKAIVFACLVFVLLFCYCAFASWRRRLHGEGEPNWYIFLFVTSLIAWLWAYSEGSTNYSSNMMPYYNVINLNVYPAVDPQLFKGQQLMDMGRAVFTQDSRLDLTKSMGFRNLDVYCVAPIVSGNGTMALYDFWAVGVNCCSGKTADFACNEFSNPMAHSALRLMHDDMLPYFRLAVQQAEAAYNIKTRHPIFMHWMQDPLAEINVYQDDGFKRYCLGIFEHFAIQLFLVVLAAVIFARMRHM